MHTKPFAVIQRGTILFTVHAYSLDQAKAIVAARVVGETVVVDAEVRTRYRSTANTGSTIGARR
ncbi:MAG: hypothetical protein C0480_01130 [Bradyrhizobium sp.]|nr:hypothetical protein [Bradyrhizobium sp.]